METTLHLRRICRQAAQATYTASLSLLWMETKPRSNLDAVPITQTRMARECASPGLIIALVLGGLVFISLPPFVSRLALRGWFRGD